MKIEVLENELKKIPQKDPPGPVSDHIIKYSRTAAVNYGSYDTVPGITGLIEMFILKVLELIPFFELFWYLNERFVKKNYVTIKLHRL